jgi:hypothetical protein
MKNGWHALLLITAWGCTYHGPTQTVVAAAHVQWSRQGHGDAFRCAAGIERLGRHKFAVSCGARTTYVSCVATCCVALSDRAGLAKVAGENPMVCDDRPR